MAHYNFQCIISRTLLFMLENLKWEQRKYLYLFFIKPRLFALHKS